MAVPVFRSALRVSVGEKRGLAPAERSEASEDVPFRRNGGSLACKLSGGFAADLSPAFRTNIETLTLPRRP